MLGTLIAPLTFFFFFSFVLLFSLIYLTLIQLRPFNWIPIVNLPEVRYEESMWMFDDNARFHLGNGSNEPVDQVLGGHPLKELSYIYVL